MWAQDLKREVEKKFLIKKKNKVRLFFLGRSQLCLQHVDKRQVKKYDYMAHAHSAKLQKI